MNVSVGSRLLMLLLRDLHQVNLTYGKECVCINSSDSEVQSKNNFFLNLLNNGNVSWNLFITSKHDLIFEVRPE